MRFPLRHARVWSTIVLVTMLFATLAPALAHAIEGLGGNAPMPVCTSAVAVTPAEVATGSDSQDERSVETRIACPFCLAATHPGAVPAPLRATLAVAPASAQAPRAPAALPLAQAQVRHAQPRAPPASC
ncbi:MAG TPA: DUF2946 family protein [Zeimonas sp.]